MNDLVLALARVDAPNEPAFRRVLGVDLVLAEEYRAFVQYRATLAQGPFIEVEIRINKTDPTGVVSLTPRPERPIRARDVDLTAFGQLANLDVNPHVPPEGSITHVFSVGRANVMFEFTAHTDILLSVSLAWEAHSGDRGFADEIEAEQHQVAVKVEEVTQNG